MLHCTAASIIMATSVLVKQKTGSWSAIFPTEQVTQQQSALFVKKLLAVAISNITYLRTIFPEHAFGDRCLEDLSLKILRDDSACPGACQVIQWVKGCFDALDRQYLRMIIVGIYVDADDPMTAVESYSFKFDYNNQKGITIFRNDEEVTSAFSEVETKKATIKLLRTIIVLTQTLQPLPDDVMMTMKLYYYDAVTPEDYEPPGFQATSCEDFEFESSAVNVKVGDVSTPFHSVKLRIKTNSSQFTPTNAEGYELLQQLQGEGTAPGDREGEGGRKDMVAEAMDAAVTVADTGQGQGNSHEPSPQEASLGPATQPPVTQGSRIHASDDNVVRCPCGVNEDDGLMVLCALCQVWQHAVCFGFLEETSVPNIHICIMCSKQHGRPATDPSLTKLPHSELQSVCLWRRTLHACCDLTRLVTPGLARRLGVGHGIAQDMMDRLEREGYIRPPAKGRKWGRVVAKEKLTKEGIPRYFKPHRSPVTSKDNCSHPANQDVRTRNQDTSTNTKDTKNQNRVEEKSCPNSKDAVKKPLSSTNGVENLTHRAADLSISAKQPKPLSLRQEVEVRRSPRIRAKRVCSVLDENKEFELSCSQEDQSCDMESGRSRKKRKASIASNSIMV